MQFKASSGYLQNTESLELQSITINDRESNTLTVYGSNTAGSFSNEITGSNDVYDLTVPNTHSFIANGMINHNTGRFSSKDPNVQNIPSHALDIRHQFRATPAMEKTSDCEETDEGIVVTLGSYDTVYMADGTEKDVIDLQVGDTIILLNNRKEVQGIVKSISDQAPNTCLCLDV